MTTTHTPSPWAYTLCEDAPYTYTPRARFASVRPGVHVTVNWSHGYHTPEQDAQYRADALAVSSLIAEVPAMLDFIRHIAENSIEDIARREARAILARIDGEA
jgi:hypothetical protein